MTACKINQRDSKSLKNKKGTTNLVARYRRTRKGEILTVDGQEWGVKGKDGSDYYTIQIGADGVLYCSCPDYKFRGHKSNHDHPGTSYMCKHVRAYLVHAAKMIESGVAMDSEAIIYNEAITAQAIVRIGREASEGLKVASQKVV